MGFNFRNHGITLDICGKNYTIDITAAGFKQIAERIKKISSELIKVTDPEQSITKCGALIDELLGTGADDEIFAEHRRTVFDYIDLLEYITAEVTRFTALYKH